MPKRACLGPGKGERCPHGAITAKPRCPACTRVLDKTRGTKQQRGYDADHDRLRAAYQRRMDAGETFDCWRCHQPINPHHWHLGHDDHDRTRYRGPECPPCNTATKGR